MSVFGFPRPFGRYTLLASLGRGGMGEVYAAVFAGGLDGIEKQCVVKMLHPDVAQDREYVERFLDEARVAIRLGQRNICQVFDVGIIEGQHFLAMELVRGRDLRTITRRMAERGASLEAGLAIHIVAEVLDGLQYAHELRDGAGAPLAIVHRDVSPQNIMVSLDGDVKLIDFGLAASTIKVEHTERNVVMGKMAYMTPEQARGERADATADVYACAIVLYELLTGARYYDGVAAMHLTSLVAAGSHEPARLGALDPALGEVLRGALRSARAERTASAAHFAAALREWADARDLRGDASRLRRFMRDLFGDVREPWEDLAASRARPSAEALATAPPASPPAAPLPAVPAGPQVDRAPPRGAVEHETLARSGSATITEAVPGRRRDAADTRPTRATPVGPQSAGDGAGRGRSRRRARAAGWALGAAAALGAVALTGGERGWRALTGEGGCARRVRIQPSDDRPIPAGTTVRFQLPRLGNTPASRQRALVIEPVDPPLTVPAARGATGSALARTVDIDDDGNLTIVVALPEVPAGGLELRASACGDEPSAAGGGPVHAHDVYVHEVDGTDTVHWLPACGVPTTDAETCRLSRLPEGPRDALQGVVRATCRVEPYDGYSMTAERALSLPPGSYIAEGSWSTSAILYDYCGGPGARTHGSVALTLNGAELARGPRPEAGGTPGRDCEANVEYQPSATSSAPVRAQLELRGGDRLGLVVEAGDCALVTAQLRLGLRRVAASEPTVAVLD